MVKSGTKSNTQIDGTSDADSINNTGTNVTIKSWAGNDSISNSGASLKVDGGNGNDTIRNWSGGTKASLSGGAGQDKIYNTASYVTITGGADYDLISLGTAAKNNVIEYKSGDGNDNVYGFNETTTLRIGNGTGTYSTTKSGSDIVVKVGNGKITLKGAASLSNPHIAGKLLITGTGNADSIANSKASVNIVAYSGNDTIRNWSGGTKGSLSGGAGQDKIYNSASYVTITGGADDDLISLGSAAKNNVIEYKSGDGNDNVYGFNETTTLRIGNGAGTFSSVKSVGSKDITIMVGTNKIILNGAASVSAPHVDGKLLIQGTGNADSITNSKASVNIAAYKGNDIIRNWSGGSNSSISGGAGQDKIYNTASNVTITGGADYDLISLGTAAKNNVIEYKSGDGNDIVYGFRADSTLKIVGGTGTYSTTKVGDDIIVTVNDGAITLRGAAKLSTVHIDGKLLIEGTSNADSITNSHAGANITAYKGNDTIKNWSGGSNSSISGGAGQDKIYNTASNVTITGGADYDLISLGSAAKNNVIEYKSGDGNDRVVGFNETTTLRIGDGTGTYSFSIDENANVIVTVDKSKITLVSAATAPKVNIKGRNPLIVTGTDNADSLKNTLDTATIQALAGNDSISNSGASVSIDAGYGNDSISNSSASIKVDGGYGNDSISNWSGGSKSSLSGGAGNDRIYNTASYVTITGGADYDLISLGAAAAKNVIDYMEGDGNDTIYGFNETTTLRIGNGLGNYSSVKNGNNVIVTVGDSKITLYGAGAASLKALNISGQYVPDNLNLSNKKPSITFKGDAGNDTLCNYAGGVTIQGLGGNDSIYSSTDSEYTINNSWGLVTIDGGDGDDTVSNYDPYVSISGGNGNDDLYTSYWNVTMRGGAGNDTIWSQNSYGNMENVLSDGGADDDFLVNSGVRSTLLGGDGHDTIHNYKDIYNKDNELLYDSIGNKVFISGGNGNDSIYNTGASVTVDGGANNDNISNNGAEYASINGGSGNDTIWNGGHDSTVLGGAGNDSIYNGGGPVTVYGGAGDDTIENSPMYVTIDGGTGNDRISLDSAATKNVIKYKSGDGNDTIYGFRADSTLSITSGVYSTTKSGDNVIVTVGDGKITLVGAAGLSKLNIFRTLTLTNNSSDKITLPDSYEVANASTRTKAIQIIGNNKDNWIVGGSGNDTLTGGAGDDSLEGGSGNDSLWGGAGNDTLFGDAGADKFIYNKGEGKDVICDFANNDMLQITGDWSASYYSATGNVVFKVGDTYSAIILKSTNASTFNINGTDYKISGSTLVKK